MLSSTINFCNKITIIPIFLAALEEKSIYKARFSSNKSVRLRARVRSNASLNRIPLRQRSNSEENGTESTVILDSLRVIGWDKLCDVVSSFARTSLGSEASKEQLWTLDQTYEESLRLLQETNAAVEIHKYNNVILDFGGLDTLLVRSAIQSGRRGFPMSGKEAVSVAAMLQFADTLQVSVKAAIKENADMYTRFTPLVEMISNWSINRTLIKLILQVVDEDGSVKDSAIPKLKQARHRVQELEKKLYQLMNNLVSTQQNKTPSGGWEISNIDGRWCIRSGSDELTGFEGLLLSSGSQVGNIIEPLSSVPLNDELQQAKALVAEAEAEVLLQLTTKMQFELEDLQNLLKDIIQLDVVNARASYSLSFGGECPELLPAVDKIGSLSAEAQPSISSYNARKEWNLYLPKAYHPLLLEQYRHKLKTAREDLANARAEIRRRRSNDEIRQKEETDIDLPMLQSKVTELEEAHPVPVDFFIDKKTRVLLITGPNAGGKTICLKTVGLASMMAKSGLYILCSEPVRIPWFDSVFADIGDDQSLSQSLSTFSGHLKKISVSGMEYKVSFTDIRARSSSQSLVLLDEIGAGTNPLEGAALGMSVVESFAEAGALLTIATTHHGELKTLKYSNVAFENACMEFDEVNLKPTYRILWGVPGRSNAINIAERLGLPDKIINRAREIYGTTSSEIDEIIADMEKFKLDIEEKVREAGHYLKVSKDLHQKLLITQRKLNEHSSNLRYRKTQRISELASMARLVLHKKKQQFRTIALKSSQQLQEDSNQHTEAGKSKHSVSADKGIAYATNKPPDKEAKKPLPDTIKVAPKVGDEVHVPSLGMKAKVLKIEPYKDAIIVQAGKFKLKLKVAEVKT